MEYHRVSTEAVLAALKNYHSSSDLTSIITCVSRKELDLSLLYVKFN